MRLSYRCLEEEVSADYDDNGWIGEANIVLLKEYNSSYKRPRKYFWTLRSLESDNCVKFRTEISLKDITTGVSCYPRILAFQGNQKILTEGEWITKENIF